MEVDVWVVELFSILVLVWCDLCFLFIGVGFVLLELLVGDDGDVFLFWDDVVLEVVCELLRIILWCFKVFVIWCWNRVDSWFVRFWIMFLGMNWLMVLLMVLFKFGWFFWKFWVRFLILLGMIGLWSD